MERIASHNLEVMFARVKALETQENNADAILAKMVEATAQAVENLSLRIILLESSHIAERDCTARFEKNCVIGDREDPNVRLGWHNVLGFHATREKRRCAR